MIAVFRCYVTQGPERWKLLAPGKHTQLPGKVGHTAHAAYVIIRNRAFGFADVADWIGQYHLCCRIVVEHQSEAVGAEKQRHAYIHQAYAGVAAGVAVILAVVHHQGVTAQIKFVASLAGTVERPCCGGVQVDAPTSAGRHPHTVVADEAVRARHNGHASAAGVDRAVDTACGGEEGDIAVGALCGGDGGGGLRRAEYRRRTYEFAFAFGQIGHTYNIVGQSCYAQHPTGIRHYVGCVCLPCRRQHHDAKGYKCPFDVFHVK